MRAVAASLVGWLMMAAVAGGEDSAEEGLQLQRLTSRGVDPAAWRIPRDAMRVFVYEGGPRGAAVTDEYIAVDYQRSGVLFDRNSGGFVRRFTVADGWPTRRHAAFGPFVEPWRKPRMIGPGIVDVRRSWSPGREKQTHPPEVAVTAQFDGRTWRALQPADFLQSVERATSRPWQLSWSGILDRLNEASCLEADPGGGAAPKRFTTADGLASNIVTHLVAHGDCLWAACVDIYDSEAKQWGPGGLCRYDRETGRWQQIKQIGGRPVRWVTLLEVAGDELWVGFREGEGVAGEQVVFGMGLYPGIYRPKSTAIVLARWAGGQWTSFRRRPLPEASPRGASPPKQPAPPTEYPVRLARVGDKLVLFSRADAHQLSGNWNVPLAGYVSLLDLKTNNWRLFDLEKELGADELMEMVAERGEVLVTSNRGVHRFDARNDAWRLLDPNSPLRNPVFHTAAVVGNELWIGYGRQSFGVFGEQGISRFDERTGRWSYMSPAELGTASPVRRIVTLANGQVWVLFGGRPYMSAAMQYDYYVRERMPRPTGLGRFADGKWEFPAVAMPESKERQQFFGPTDDLAAVGDKLVCSSGSNVYVGPGPWRKIADGPIVGIAPAEDGKAVEIIRRSAGADGGPDQAFQRGVYHAEDTSVAWRPFQFDNNSVEQYHYVMGNSLIEPWRSDQARAFRPAGPNDDTWVVTQTGGGYYGSSALVTPAAVWIFSHGEIVRLDRSILAKLAQQRTEKN